VNRTALELLHPDGSVSGVAVGGAARLPAVPQASRSDVPLDLVVLAPSAAGPEGASSLERLLDSFVPRLSADAVVYVLVRPRRRRAARRELLRRGLALDRGVAHVPSFESTRYLVPLEPRLARRVFREVIAVWPRRRRMLASLLELSWTAAALERLMPSVALVARPPTARPLFDWASRLLADGADTHAEAVVTTGRAEADRAVVLLVQSGREEGSVVAKIGDASSPRLEREVEALAGPGLTARVAGAAVPKPIGQRVLGGRSVLFETGLAGASAAGLLASEPRRLQSILELVSDWLDRWHGVSVVEHSAGPEELRSRVLSPAERLAPLLGDGEDYLSWLRCKCKALAGHRLPFVHAHNDLTMFNVLVTEIGVGVVDWEDAGERGLPLTDFFYAAVDAVAATARYTDRLAAFDACFGEGGRYAGLVAGMQRRLTSTAAMSAELKGLAFHACWLHHAANEQLKSSWQRPSPFLSIVQRLAARPDAWQAGTAA
jgi:hypothetical protein